MICVPSYLIHQEKLNDQLEEQRQEQALHRYRCEADQLDHWLLSTKATLDIALGSPKEPMDMEAQLVDCQVQKWSPRSMPTSLGRLFKNVGYWLRQILVAACRIFRWGAQILWLWCMGSGTCGLSNYSTQP